jgi:filamentous hemagglutinin
VDTAFGSQYSLGRVLADATVGGASASLQGGNFGDGFKLAGSLSALTYAATSMREAMVEQSKIDARNAAGVSDGFRGDRFKLGGCRAPCTSSLLGGAQGGSGFFFGHAYAPGSFLDRLIETYAGPHDFLNAPLFYNSVGNNVVRTGVLSSIIEPVSFANVAVATPFALATVIPPYAYPNQN